MIAIKERESPDQEEISKVLLNADDLPDAIGSVSGGATSSVNPNNTGTIPKLTFNSYNSPVPDRHAAEYNMNHKHRGMALIFNHKDFDARLEMPSREGTDVDCANLWRVLKKLDFDVSIHPDLCHKEILKVISNAASQNHEDNDCLVVIILSHGDLGYICANDFKYKLADICGYFTPNNCPTLAGKPKLFFVQACQGYGLDAGVTLQRVVETESSSSMSYKIPLHADFLIAYSTIPGYFSWRSKRNGSWFIQSLCAELEANGKRLDLISLLTFVCRRVAVDFESNNPDDPEKHKQKQIPCITTMLTRIVLFKEKPKATSKVF